MRNQIVNALKDDFDLFEEDLRKLMQIQSISNHKEKVIHALNYVVNLAKNFGLDADTYIDNSVGVVEYGQGPQVCGVLCHVDVVKVNEDKWDYNPFDLSIVDDILYGRGIVDGKGPLLMILYILKYFKQFDIKVANKIQLIIGTQEEVVWTDIEDYKKEYRLPDFGFTPDGFFPIQNAEKGLLDIAFEFEKDNIESISAGKATNMIPSTFDIDVDGHDYHFSGKSYHSAFPEKGKNAIVSGCQQLINSHSNFLFDFVSDYLSDMYGGKFNLRKDDIVNEEHYNRTTIVPTMIEDGMDKLFLSVNIRLAHSNTYDKIIDTLEHIKEGYQFTYTCFDYIKPIYIDPKADFVRKLAKSYETITNLEVEYLFASNTSYAKALPNFVCFGPVLVGEKDTSHLPNEQMKMSSFFKVFNIYCAALLNLTK